MAHTMASALRDNFLGNSPDWYTVTMTFTGLLALWYVPHAL